MAKKKKKKHISEKFSFKGILSRNSSYREDARSKLKGTLIYDNAANILNGIQQQDAAQTAKGNKAPPTLASQVARVKGYTFNYKKRFRKRNFTTAGPPYRNEAHHVVPVEIFYKKEWTTPHLHIVKSAKADPDNDDAPGYNINNADNIIYLPQCNKKYEYMQYHVLPDHSEGHKNYNTRVKGQCDPIWDLADEALNEPDCDRKKDLRKQIHDMLKQIETNNFNHLKGLGTNPMS
jgi:A nuclease family of the HNH/ENDO VII superfamily with conserved AHH